MTAGPAGGERRPRMHVAIAIAALLFAAAAFALPALDSRLPGGAISWQLGGLAVAVVSAAWALRAAGTPEADVARRRTAVRVIAIGALVLALAWVGGVAVLWLLWPR